MSQLQRMSRTSLLVLATALLAASAAAAGVPDTARKKGPVGIDCAATKKSGASFAALGQAEKIGDWPKAIQLLRGTIADQQCGNSYLFQRLALFYGRAGKAAEAFEVAAYALAQDPNQVAANLETREPEVESLNELRALPGFESSAFARNLAARYAEREKRLAAARQRLAQLPEAERPPDPYVAKEACPFECCTFREWTVEQEIPLYRAPGGEPLGRKLSPGDKALGLTGEVHLEPHPMLAGVAFAAEESFDSDKQVQIPAGAIVFQLDYVGEGFANFWYRGRTFVAEMAQCLVTGPDCWGEAIEPAAAAEPRHDWWVKVRLADGTEAWARDEGFGNMDGCG